MSSDVNPIHPPKVAHVAICPGCENPTLVTNLDGNGTAMQCPRCGNTLRPADITTYERTEVDDA